MTERKARRRVRRSDVRLEQDEAASPAALTLVETQSAPTHERLKLALEQLNGVFAERQDALRCMAIALVTGMNYLLIGPRGTAKTALATCLMTHVEGARHFSTLLGSFSTMNDLVGRIDLAELQRGREVRKVEGRLLDCDTAFLDEALKGSDGVLNSLLGLLSDNRDFEGKRVDLWSVGSATNWPEVNRRTDRIGALYDRFHLKVPVVSVQSRAGRIQVLRAARTIGEYRPAPGTTITLQELQAAAEEVREVAIAPEIEELLCSVQERCLKEDIEVSDRKLGQWQRAIQASAWLDGRDEVCLDDFDVLLYMAWDDAKDIDKAKSIIDTCDREISQQLIKRVDDVRSGYQEARREGFDAEKAGKVLDEIIATAEYVGKAMKTYRLRPESKKDVSRAVANLKKDFDSLYSQFKPALEDG